MTQKGYEYHPKSAEAMQNRGRDSVTELFTNNQVWGTPKQVIEKLAWIGEVGRPLHLNCSFAFGGMPYDYAEVSMRLFSKTVLPRLKTWACVLEQQTRIVCLSNRYG